METVYIALIVLFFLNGICLCWNISQQLDINKINGTIPAFGAFLVKVAEAKAERLVENSMKKANENKEPENQQ